MLFKRFFSIATLILSASIADTNTSYAANDLSEAKVKIANFHEFQQHSARNKKSVQPRYTFDEVMSLLRNNQIIALSVLEISDLNKEKLLQLMAEIKNNTAIIGFDLKDGEIEGVKNQANGHDPEVLAGFVDLLMNSYSLEYVGIQGLSYDDDHAPALYTSKDLEVITAAFKESKTLWGVSLDHWPAMNAKQLRVLSKWIVENKNIDGLDIEIYSWNDYPGDSAVIETSQKLLQAVAKNNIFRSFILKTNMNSWN